MNNPMNDIYSRIYTQYGIQPMTFEEELTQLKYAKQTRYNKIKIIDTCKHAKSLLETIEWRTKGAPELDDVTHAALVQEMYDKVNEAYEAIVAACRVGY